jgi:hypothetical protein
VLSCATDIWLAEASARPTAVTNKERGCFFDETIDAGKGVPPFLEEGILNDNN